jgi:pimeloyl-ACP methyl ester carboxylesterase
VVVLVSSALADREATRRLARLLADRYTVINYDRRGRGSSGDTQRYTPQREVEDIEALIDQEGDTAFLFGSPSGAALALEAASQLNGRVKALFLYEPPFIVDASRPPIPADLRRRVTELIATVTPNDGITTASTKNSFTVAMPGWPKMVGMASTTLCDLALLERIQNGTPLPKNRWAANLPTVVMVGSRSEPFFHSGARALTEVLPRCQYKMLEGGSHGSVVLGPKPIAAAMAQFFAARAH